MQTNIESINFWSIFEHNLILGKLTACVKFLLIYLFSNGLFRSSSETA